MVPPRDEPTEGVAPARGAERNGARLPPARSLEVVGPGRALPPARSLQVVGPGLAPTPAARNDTAPARPARSGRPSWEALYAAEATLLAQQQELLAAQQALEAERQRYQDLFELAPDGYIVTDARGVIREANRAAATLFNRRFSSQYLVGKPLAALVHDDDRWEFYRQVARLQQGSEVHDWRLQLGAVRGPGAPVSATVAAVSDATGRTVGLRWLLRDVSERIVQEAAAVARQRQQAALLQLGQRMMATTDLGALLDEFAGLLTHVLDVDCCEVLELDAGGDTLRVRVSTGWPAETDEREVGADRETEAGYALTCGAPLIVEDRRAETRFRPSPRLLRRRVVSSVTTAIPGRPRPFGVLSVHTTGLRAFTLDEVYFLQAAAHPLGLAAMRARTETEWADHLAQAVASAAHLHELETLRRSLLSAVSHELLTPLSIIKGHAETLRDPETRADADVADLALVTIDEEVDRLRRLVSNLLDAARATSGELRVDREPMALGPLVDRIVRRFQGRSRRHQFVVHRPDALPLVLGDRNRLESVIYNLLDNAVKYAPRGGEVAVLVASYPLEVEVIVEDQGVGVSAAEQARIFQPYYRAQPDARPRVEGSGLGLYICRTIVEAHGGRMWVQSAPGQGTAFHFTVPRADHAPDEPPEPEGAAS
jgi:PAS domain S-box-containing protein